MGPTIGGWRSVRLGLRENARQFALLVAINALVGAMVGLERATLPLVADDDFGLAGRTVALSFIVAFGVAKAVTNLVAGGIADRAGRKRLLVAGWALAVPVPLLVGLAPSWGFIVAANLLLGVSQGLAWSMTVVMKIDLVGPRRRGLALGLNESAGYGGLALAAVASGWLAAELAPREAIAAGGLVVALVALAVSVFVVRDTAAHVALEQRSSGQAATLGVRVAFADATYRDRGLRACSQAGLVNNLNDGLMWGLAPLFLAVHGASLQQIGLVAGVYPAVWGVGQLLTGALSDRVGRKPLIVSGMLVQAVSLMVLMASGGAFVPALLAAVLLGAGTALVYPTLLAAVSDHVAPAARAAALGVYRFWRDAGYAVGAVVAGALADVVSFEAAIGVVAALTGLSGVWVGAGLPGGWAESDTPSPEQLTPLRVDA